MKKRRLILFIVWLVVGCRKEKEYAKADAQFSTDGTTFKDSPIVVCQECKFTKEDEKKTVFVASDKCVIRASKILTVLSPSVIIVSTKATDDCGKCNVMWGTDDTQALTKLAKER